MSTAVIGAPGFRARSGRTVRVGDDGTVMFDHANGYLSPASAMDAEEFFQAKRDEGRGWWRWPENPSCIVRESEDRGDFGRGRTVLVFDEESFDRFHFNERVREAAPDTSIAHRAARAYFEAHPEHDLPSENGVYVPVTAGLGEGPLTFVLYNESWRATPDCEDAAEVAREWHARTGLVRLSKVEDAS